MRRWLAVSVLAVVLLFSSARAADEGIELTPTQFVSYYMVCGWGLGLVGFVLVWYPAKIIRFFDDK